jgi:hypothetical protein
VQRCRGAEVQKAGLSTEIDSPDEFLMTKPSQSDQRDSEVQRCCGSALRQNWTWKNRHGSVCDIQEE